ncbi:sensor histidine kinase [Lachnobacterium bovis]|uniref:sensor histidine kinase n=1 Tax=Lachnobacterium bovis TaxID=140626 RepID=UPI0006926005|nr:ATP-binding protein [Lachnobacterium bovis]
MINKFKNLQGKITLFFIAWIFGMIMAVLSMAILTMIFQKDFKAERNKTLKENYKKMEYECAKNVVCNKIQRIYYPGDNDNGNQDRFEKYKYRIVDRKTKEVVSGTKFTGGRKFTFFCPIDRAHSVGFIRRGELSDFEIKTELSGKEIVVYKEEGKERQIVETKVEMGMDDDDTSFEDEKNVVQKRDATVDDFCIYTIDIKYVGNYLENSNYSVALKIIDSVNNNKSLIIFGEVVSVIIFVVSYILLLCVAGRRKEEGVYPGYLDKVPIEVLGIAICFIYMMILNSSLVQASSFYGLIVIGGLGFTLIAIFIGLSMSFAVRLKEGSVIKNSVAGYTYRFIKSSYNYIIKKIGEELKEITKKELIIAFVFVYIGIAFFYGILLIGYRSVIAWFLFNLIIFGFLLKTLVDVINIKEGIKRMASGETKYKIKSQNMLSFFKAEVEDINNISQGIEIAVSEKTKSERMKTELITNVSHDIKTPLTSIINYVDFIKKEVESERMNESAVTDYCDVLGRQSIKLKRLIEDLVEASKASTGNLEINLMPCEASVFLNQISGEYREKFEEKELEMVLDGLENNLRIMADGRRMFRVFDNIMNNICKYSQAKTRVYIELSKKDDNAEFSFKNISKDPLNISPDELMERFVRGDKSRNTEGNGLGLSIARSMTNLQGGDIQIEIDGDLFKVKLSFPLIYEEEGENNNESSDSN